MEWELNVFEEGRGNKRESQGRKVWRKRGARKGGKYLRRLEWPGEYLCLLGLCWPVQVPWCLWLVPVRAGGRSFGVWADASNKRRQRKNTCGRGHPTRGVYSYLACDVDVLLLSLDASIQRQKVNKKTEVPL